MKHRIIILFSSIISSILLIISSYRFDTLSIFIYLTGVLLFSFAAYQIGKRFPKKDSIINLCILAFAPLTCLFTLFSLQFSAHSANTLETIFPSIVLALLVTLPIIIFVGLFGMLSIYIKNKAK